MKTGIRQAGGKEVFLNFAMEEIGDALGGGQNAKAHSGKGNQSLQGKGIEGGGGCG